MSRTLCFAVRRCGRWIGIARIGADEHQTIAAYDTRQEATDAAREMAARVMRAKEVRRS